VQRLSITGDSVSDAVAALRPTREEGEQVRGAAADIVQMVREGGDEAVRRLTRRLDGVDVPAARVPRARLDEALTGVATDVREALELLAANLRRTATAALPQPTREELPHGQIVATRQIPVDRVGVYVPGGRAAYPSSAVMAVVPAQVAGVAGIAVCSPPGPDGLPDRTVLAACALLGVEEVHGVGGAQAIAALALGTETIGKVDLIVGPGNVYVEEAKRGLFGEVGIESLAGPSELVVLADGSVSPAIVAWDLRAQAEHGSGSQSVLVSTDPAALERIEAELEDAEAVTIVEADSLDTALLFINAYAPEHLQLAVADPRALLDRVRHAGAVFLGELSGTAYGDYIAGSNHILPTAGNARFSSGLSPGVFLRAQEVVEVPPEAARALAGPLAALARAEGLTAHARSAEVRAELTENDTPLERGAAT
jgi:histidinol dehydrogenase